MRETKPQPSLIQTWIAAIRPKTLWAAVVPIIIGSAMAFADGLFHAPAAIAALAGAIFIQIGTNFTNDYADFKKGADTEDRKGPLRVMQAGLVSDKTMLSATAFVFGLAVLAGLYLIMRGGMPILYIGIISIICGIWYTAGPYPLAYLGLGDLFVLVFFGPVAVAGTYYVQTLTVTPESMIAGIAPGLLSVAILAVNNIRDIDEDQIANKRTLPVRFGRNFGIIEYVFCLVGAVTVPAVLVLRSGDHFWALTSMIILIPALPILRTLKSETAGEALNPMLGATAKLLLIFSVLFSIGWII